MYRDASEKVKFTQDAIAVRMRIIRSVISQLKTFSAIRHSPSIEILLKYATALNFRVDIFSSKAT